MSRYGFLKVDGPITGGLLGLPEPSLFLFIKNIWP